MTHPLYVAIIWHQHQPLYKSRGNLNPAPATDGNGDRPSPTSPENCNYRLPWVRLHGTKDYLDLVQILADYPKLHQTVNLVPSLILQLEDYIEGRAMDPYLALSLTDTKELGVEEKRFIVEHFFDGNHHTLVDPHPRYKELYEQRQDKGIGWCLDNWGDGEFGDLLAWHNLAWIDPLFWDDPEIAAWLEQDRGFSLSDRQEIWEKQRQILARILPQHKKMQDAGQLEVITTPYTHPILPLLADTDAGRVAVPQMDLPEQQFSYPEDIPRHLDKAVEMYRDRFGKEPVGLWPSEQSVSPAMLKPVAEAGFKWLCTDEATLGWTVEHFFHRDGYGNIQEPQLLYRPYRLETDAGDLSIVFRDHRLSDLIGFTYGNMDPIDAAEDLIGHLDAIGRSLAPAPAVDDNSESSSDEPEFTGHSLDEPWLVTIALDGENCWEYYPEDGKPFLENLYSRLSDRDDIRLVTVGEFLNKFPPTETLPADSLHSGSWVDGSFTTWIGDPAKNRAWDLLTDARATLAKHPEATEKANPEAWEALYAAEGSDWFWWFGAGHSSNQDAMFDQLFREHLAALYTALDEPIPDVLLDPVEDHNAPGDRAPTSFIHPFINGRGDEQDWDHAGRIEVGGSRGTMHQASAIQRLWYGVDHLNFYIRLDFKTGVEPGKDCPSEIHLLWYYPDRSIYNSPPPLGSLPEEGPGSYQFRDQVAINLTNGTVWSQYAIDYGQWEGRETQSQGKFDKCLEMAVPWEELPVEPDSHLELVVITAEQGKYQGFLPDNRLISLQRP
ncbi:MAG: glycoside hydrolase [Cyanophyceae cyanobacterium]